MSKPNQEQPAKDDPSSAPESGDPCDCGRSRGQVVEPDQHAADIDAEDQSEEHTGEEFESGRHDAVPHPGGERRQTN